MAASRGRRRYRGDRPKTMGEKRGLVKARTHRWCRKCHGRGYLKGQGGAKLPHGPCKGDGLVKVGAGRGRGRAGRTVKLGATIGGAAALWSVASQTFGTIGQVAVVVTVVAVVALKVVAFVLRGVAAVVS